MTDDDAVKRQHNAERMLNDPLFVEAWDALRGRLLGWSVYNTNAAVRYVKLHNQTTSPTAGSGVVLTIAVPPNNCREFNMPGGIAFATGIGFTTTVGGADNDSQAVGAGDLIIDLFYM